MRKDHLDEERSLNQLIELAIPIDNLIRSRRPTRTIPISHCVASTSSSPSEEPMQLEYTYLSPEDLECRITQRLCLYCGQAGHLWDSCPTQPPLRTSSAVSPCIQTHHSKTCLKVPIKLSHVTT